MLMHARVYGLLFSIDVKFDSNESHRQAIDYAIMSHRVHTIAGTRHYTMCL